MMQHDPTPGPSGTEGISDRPAPVRFCRCGHAEEMHRARPGSHGDERRLCTASRCLCGGYTAYDPVPLRPMLERPAKLSAIRWLSNADDGLPSAAGGDWMVTLYHERGYATCCRLRIWGHDAERVACVTEIRENRGPSVTHCAEDLWEAILATYDVGDQALLFEHWPDAAPSDDSLVLGEHFNQVIFPAATSTAALVKIWSEHLNQVIFPGRGPGADVDARGLGPFDDPCWGPSLERWQFVQLLEREGVEVSR